MNEKVKTEKLLGFIYTFLSIEYKTEEITCKWAEYEGEPTLSFLHYMDAESGYDDLYHLPLKTLVDCVDSFTPEYTWCKKVFDMSTSDWEMATLLGIQAISKEDALWLNPDFDYFEVAEAYGQVFDTWCKAMAIGNI